MLSTLLNNLSTLSCRYTESKKDDILAEDYGVNICVQKDPLESYKYFKIQKDFYNYYKDFNKNELKSLDLLYKQKENKLQNIISVDDEMYSWFLANINSINLFLNKPSHKTHVQKIESLTWIFNHNLGFEVNIEVLDENNNPILGYTRIDTDNFNTITLTWSVPVKGKIIAS